MAQLKTATPLLLLLVIVSHEFFAAATPGDAPPIVDGLSWTFYHSTCPELEDIIRNELNKVFDEDVGQAAGLLRLHFHDCFVQGCDGSVLLDGSGGRRSEKAAIPNLSLRAETFKIINDLRALIDAKCGDQIVSCADITAIAARDSVYLSGGPHFDIPLGRRDSQNFSSTQTVEDTLPKPSSTASVILSQVAQKNLDATDLVALSGGHTIGRAHCQTFTSRLYPQDSTMDKTFAENLKETCPTLNFNATTVLDLRSPNTFDNKYYVNLMNRQGLFTSDEDLYMDKRTKGIVTSFALNQTLFFEKFVLSMVKMGQFSVLTGDQGEIRKNCSATNADSFRAWSVVDGDDGQEYGKSYE